MKTRILFLILGSTFALPVLAAAEEKHDSKEVAQEQIVYVRGGSSVVLWSRSAPKNEVEYPGPCLRELTFVDGSGQTLVARNPKYAECAESQEFANRKREGQDRGGGGGGVD